MATLKASTFVLNSSSSSTKQRGFTVRAAATRISLPGIQSNGFLQLHLRPVVEGNRTVSGGNGDSDPVLMAKLYAILEAVSDRVEMHRNIGEQRDNWNTLLLTSINSITLSAAVMAGIAAVSGGAGAPVVAMKLSSTAMYVAATGLLSIVNKIQPSQLAEEQRNAVRLFKQIKNQIQTLISLGNPTAVDVKGLAERVLALDRAYPLPLLGVMLDKFPDKFQPAVWWPEQRRRQQEKNGAGFNGWNGKLEDEMMGIGNVLGSKDEEEYMRLGTKALNVNKFLAMTGPMLTALAAVGSAFIGSASDAGWAVTLGVMGGALASVVNAVEHGGQVGMVVEMYRNNAGFFKMMEESIESNLREEDLGRRENGEVFEIKLGLKLGRSLSEVRDLAAASSVEREAIDEFASKLF